MNVTNPTRRNLLKTFGMAATLPLLGGVRQTLAQTPIDIRVAWWGSQERARRTGDVAKLAEQALNLKINVEPAGSDYFEKLVTQMSGGNAPDVCQTDQASLPDFARRGGLTPLDDLVPNPLDVAKFGKPVLDLATVDGHLYGVPIGMNSVAMILDRAVYTNAGLKAPTYQTTWAEFADLSVALTKAVNRQGYWGSTDQSRLIHVFEIFVRQRGKALFTADQKLGFDESDLVAWFTYWDDMRKRGGCVPPDVAALDLNTIETSALVRNVAPVQFAWSSQLVSYQTLYKPALDLQMYPAGGAGSKPGQFLRPALIWSISKSSKNVDAAARFINFFVHNPDAGKILGVERGIPAATEVLAAIQPQLTDSERKTLDFFTFIEDKVGPYPVPTPSGTGQFTDRVFSNYAQQVAFGRMTPEQAGDRIIREGKRLFK